MSKSVPMASSFEGFFVIGLVGLVLAAVLSPVYTSAKAAARTSRCTGNLRFLAQSMSLYAEEDQGRFIDARQWSYRLLPGTEHLTGYGEARERFTCLDSVGIDFSYAMNEALSRKPFSTLPKPEAQPLFFDSKVLMPDTFGDLSLLPDPPRHNGVNRVVYVDGHLGNLRREEGK